MKKTLFSLLAATLVFVFACQPSSNENRNANANANASATANKNQTVAPPTAMAPTDKIVQIFIHDDPAKPGYYEIEDPGSVTLAKKRNQRIIWCVVYDGATPPSDVVMDHFVWPPPPATPTSSDPFGSGAPGENTFDIPAADFNNCKHPTKTPKAEALGKYKYTITVKVGSEERARLDPQVVIDD